MQTEKKDNIDNAMQALRQEYEQTADQLDGQPEPKPGREMRGLSFPRWATIIMGALAIGMFAFAIFLFSLQPEPDRTEVIEQPVITAIFTEDGVPIPTPPLLFEPPIPEDAIPLPPEPTPWPTPALTEDG